MTCPSPEYCDQNGCTANGCRRVDEATSLVNRAHNAIGSDRYDRATVKSWLRQAVDRLAGRS